MKPLGTISRGAFFCLFLALPAAFAGCRTLEGAQRGAQDYADGLSGFSKLRIPTSTFKLTSYHRFSQPGSPLVVYIEGDGIAFISDHHVSPDPTPARPMMLALAKMDPSANVAYLARPCQFDGSAAERPCHETYWTDARFSKEVIASMNEAVEALKKESGATTIELVGFSGGGAVAVLVAARRNDVASIRTLAGNLDPDGVNRHHRVPLLKNSLDPMDAAQAVAGIPQRHFTGAKDNVVPPQTAESFRKAAGGACIQITPVDGASHHSGWEERWGLLLRLPVSCAESA